MKVWTIANQKGGVGKTTSVITLAGILSKLGKRVLVIDTDPHASLGYYLGIDSEEVPGSLYDLFLAHDQLSSDLVNAHIVPTAVECLDLLPATMALATVDRKLGHVDGMGLLIRNILSHVSGRYDYVLIDCPPVLGVLMVNALAACNQIIIPVQTEFLALKGLERMVKTMGLMGRSQQEKYQFTIVPTMFDKRTKASPFALAELQKNYSEFLWSDVIPVDTKFRDSSLAHLPASYFSPSCRGVKAYEKLLKYIESLEPTHD
ncbi:ParA family protein [Parashewanella spongiae]|uniref:ParA family protein n=1 Tax=Parashewanella spongiae TaxID=342950 RepID=A0A3A6TZ50_9GAMM|nr:ParA family protein [Parashewanella spongiae]MCL1077665.1 ParA family protein [Parashewanella spongiae]RJY18249.1 ParA family protein [Parashewanella spongiae]